MHLRCDLKALLQILSHGWCIIHIWYMYSLYCVNHSIFESATVCFPLKMKYYANMWIQESQVQITWKADFNCFNCSITSNHKHTSLDGWAHWMNWDFFHWVPDHVTRHDSHCNTFWCWPFWSLDFFNFENCFLWTLISLTYYIHLVLHQLRAHGTDTSANMSVSACLLPTHLSMHLP